jgi:hypothetical protein
VNLLKKSNMDNHRLLASAALFRGMYSQKLDQYDVLADFIKATVTLHNLHTFDVTMCTAFLKQDFGFDIPEAVVRNCMKSKLKQQFRRIPGGPDWERLDGFSPSPRLEHSFAESHRAQEGLTRELIRHAEEQCKRMLTEDEKAKLTDDFIAHLKGAPRQNQNFPYIGHFILSLEKDSTAKQILEDTRQGLILFDGLRYSAEHRGANLTTNLTIFVDTEILFSAVGYHGELRQQLFQDFLSLVTDVNEKAKKNDGKIFLRYFDETDREVQNYFDAAIAIVEKQARLEPNKQAMRSIVNGCAGGADVIAKKVRFMNQLATFKIRKEEDRNYYDPPTYNIESQSSVAALINELGCDPDRAAQVLKQFSRINFLRRGESKTHLEVAGFIQLSDKNLTRSAAFSRTVCDLSGKTVPFATDLDYMTERLWFKLNRGFSTSGPVLATFDVVARTRIVLSSQLANKVADEYQRLVEEHKKTRSTMTDELLAQFVSELMSKLRQPEEVTNDSLDLAFLADDDFVSHAVAAHSALTLAAAEGREVKTKLVELREQSELERNELQRQLTEMQQIQDQMKVAQQWKDARHRRRERNRPYVYRAAFACAAADFLYWVVPILVVCAVIHVLKTDADSRLAEFGTYFTVVPVVIAVLGLYVLKRKFSGLVSRLKRQYLLKRLDRIDRCDALFAEPRLTPTKINF